MGLGLTISKMILDQLGGNIFAKSIEGLGSSFSFSVPINESVDVQDNESKSILESME